MHFSSIEFRLAKHSVTGLDMVEVWGDGMFIASIYQAPNGIKIISKHTDKALVVLDIRHDPTQVLIDLTRALAQRREAT